VSLARAVCRQGQINQYASYAMAWPLPPPPAQEGPLRRWISTWSGSGMVVSEAADTGVGIWELKGGAPLTLRHGAPNVLIRPSLQGVQLIMCHNHYVDVFFYFI